MKKVLVLAMVATFGLAGSALAFHDGGVANCDGCHTMHNSENGLADDADLAGGQFHSGPYLLKGDDQSSACLNCHEGTDAKLSSYRVSTFGVDAELEVPLQRSPGGDFSWLRAATAFKTTTKSSKGHNINAADFSYTADSRLTVAPGSAYPANALGCQSCHDPHGKYRTLDGTNYVTTGAPIEDSGSYDNSPAPTATAAVGAYRILGGVGYQPKSLTGSFAFANTVPVAIAPATYNLATAEGGVRVGYGSGMSEWCANCHGQIHTPVYTSGVAGLTHPADSDANLPGFILDNYNTYVSSGIMTGAQATSYLSLVPYEEGESVASLADLKTLVGTVAAAGTHEGSAGPTSGSNVMCLSCHRVHASGFNSMLRWENSATFITEDGATYDPVEGINSANQLLAAYYGKPASDFGALQRNLCNKCHAKD